MPRKFGDTGFSTFAYANSLPAYAFALQIACLSTFAYANSLPAYAFALQIACLSTFAYANSLSQALIIFLSKKIIAADGIYGFGEISMRFFEKRFGGAERKPQQQMHNISYMIVIMY